MEYTNALVLFGRILFGMFFVMNAMNHFTKSDKLSQYAQSKGVSSPKAMVQLTGLVLLLAGLGIVLGVWVKIAVALIVIFMLGVSFQMHAFWKLQDEQAKMMDMVHFMKNMALMGAALMLLAIPEPWMFSL